MAILAEPSRVISLDPKSSRPFSIEGRGVDASRIFRAEAYAFVS
jgi:hypothetical protein